MKANANANANVNVYSWLAGWQASWLAAGNILAVGSMHTIDRKNKRWIRGSVLFMHGIISSFGL